MAVIARLLAAGSFSKTMAGTLRLSLEFLGHDDAFIFMLVMPDIVALVICT